MSNWGAAANIPPIIRLRKQGGLSGLFLNGNLFSSIDLPIYSSKQERGKFMRLFVGWSGETSKKIAKSLKDWIEKVNPNVVPFVSFEDISLGTNWNNALSEELTNANYGLLCVTTDNMKAPWLLYEAGQMEFAMRQKNPQGQAYITPLLFGVEHSGNLASPLSHYQSAQFSREAMERLVTQMNGVCRNLYGVEVSKARPGDRIDKTYLDASELQENFERHYTKLEAEITWILQGVGSQSSPNGSAISNPAAPETDILTALSEKMENIYFQFGSYPEIARVYYEGRQLLDQLRDKSVSQFEKSQDLLRFHEIVAQAVDRLRTDMTDSNPNRRTRMKVLRELHALLEEL